MPRKRGAIAHRRACRGDDKCRAKLLAVKSSPYSPCEASKILTIGAAKASEKANLRQASPAGERAIIIDMRGNCGNACRAASRAYYMATGLIAGRGGRRACPASILWRHRVPCMYASRRAAAHGCIGRNNISAFLARNEAMCMPAVTRAPVRPAWLSISMARALVAVPYGGDSALPSSADARRRALMLSQAEAAAASCAR